MFHHKTLYILLFHPNRAICPKYFILHDLNLRIFGKSKARSSSLRNFLHHPMKRTFFFLWRCDPTRVMASSFLRFLNHTQRRTTVDRTPLDEWSACRRDLYLITHNTHNRQTSMPLVGFEPTISAGERPQTYALDRAATGTGMKRPYST